MKLYAGLDLHARNTYIGIMDKEFKRIFGKRVSNNLPLIIKTLEPFQDQLQSLVVESTYNWYWLVDGLMDVGYDCLHLANPAAMKQYEGMKKRPWRPAAWDISPNQSIPASFWKPYRNISGQ
jgi:transposase